jgi:hypothetical protein
MRPAMTANTHTELAVATVDRIKQLKAERKRYFDVEGDGVDEVLSECWSTIESLSSKLEAAREALRTSVEALGRVNVRCFNTSKSPLKPIGDIARNALFEIMKQLGDEAYDEIVRTILSEGDAGTSST